MKLNDETFDWLAEQAGTAPRNATLWQEALTHGSMGETIDYQRLEFLGDRVLGLVIAEWLYERNDGAEGKLSQRLNALVSRESCARVARDIELQRHMRLGKQARADGGLDSDNILGDIIESLIGACLLDHDFSTARGMVRKWFADEVEGRAGQRKHPKSALQEWAAGNRRKPPEYELVERSGPDHASRFTVRVSVNGVGEAFGEGDSKQQAETAAAERFLDEHG
ncbi:ribonuclease III [Croceicoccus ponticola]|nr:ribonuclease III [Croceicoccus ponticola]